MDRGYERTVLRGRLQSPSPRQTLPEPGGKKNKCGAARSSKLVTYDAAGRATPQQDLGMGEIA